MSKRVDFVISFRTSSDPSISKQKRAEDAQRAERQYARLLSTLNYAGLRAVGRRGDSLGHILVFVSCPDTHVANLVKREGHSDFLHGLPTARIPSEPLNLEVEPLAPSDRLRLIYSYITSTPEDGGLGISPDSPEWEHVESISPLHNHEFNEKWVRAWSRIDIPQAAITKLRDQFGEGVAMYFAFLRTYMQALVFPATIGVHFFFFGESFSPIYSFLLLVWATAFTEYWRVHERILSLRFGARGSFRVEKRRAQYKPGFVWWKRELRTVASVPAILTFAGLLAGLLSVMFLWEAFMTQLYRGPGQKLVAFSPTILFILLVPRFLALYQKFARRFTAWENHAHLSTYNASLTLKTFVCSSLVAYLGLALSAFVYLPFGEGIMNVIQVILHTGVVDPSVAQDGDNIKVWDLDAGNGRKKLNPSRLRDQMFAYTVTNQIVNTFTEVGLPYLLRFIDNLRSGKGLHEALNGKKKKVIFEDEKGQDSEADVELLEQARNELALPEYDLFGDYNEMVTQYGYIVLWSTIWPLAPVMALVNNFFEMRSDAFKMTVHHRRPIPQRTDTIGPWLDALTSLTWVSAVTNSALVYLFCPRTTSSSEPGLLSQWMPFTSPDGLAPVERVQRSFAESSTRTDVFVTAAMIALAASHGYMFLRIVMRHLMERIFWVGSKEVQKMEEREKYIKEGFIRSAGASDLGAEGKLTDDANGVFGGRDEGIDEIRRIMKEA